MTKTEQRRRRFRAALALAGTTAAEWAKTQGVSAVTVHLVSTGERKSDRIDAAIDALIARYKLTTVRAA